METLFLRIQRFLHNLSVRFIYPDLPFDIAWTDLHEGEYEYPKGRKILADFNVGKRKYIIMEEN